MTLSIQISGLTSCKAAEIWVRAGGGGWLASDARQHLGETVRHELELAVRGNEANGAIRLKAGKANTLVKLDVFELDALAFAWRRGQPPKRPHPPPNSNKNRNSK
jgi:hypothetical protein